MRTHCAPSGSPGAAYLQLYRSYILYIFIYATANQHETTGLRMEAAGAREPASGTDRHTGTTASKYYPCTTAWYC